MWLLSDRTLPRTFRTMQGFGVHTFRWVNAQGQSRFVKYHWKPIAGLHSNLFDEAQRLAGKDPDFHHRDLWDAIDISDFPEYKLGVQIIEEADEHTRRDHQSEREGKRHGKIVYQRDRPTSPLESHRQKSRACLIDRPLFE